MTKWFDPKNFEDMITRFNPFGFKDESGDSKIFENYGKVYKYTIERLIYRFPRGFIDMPLFVHYETQLPLPDSERVVYSWHSLKKYEDGIILLEWWKDDRERERVLRSIFLGLHEISGTTLDEAYFKNMLYYIDPYIAELKLDPNYRKI